MNKKLLISDDRSHPYPGICAHRGLHIAAPENSLSAFGDIMRKKDADT